MSLLADIKKDVDPMGWNSPNSFDEMLLEKHPLTRKPRKKDNKLRLSWSLVKTGLLCPRAGTWTARPEDFGIDPNFLTFKDSLASLRGNLAQTLLEHTYTHDYLSLPPDQFLHALQASWRWGILSLQPLRTITPEELVKLRTEIFSKLPTIFQAINREGFWAKKQEAEMPLWWDTPQMVGTRLTGKADFVLKDPDKYWLIDGKYVNKPETLDSRQLSFYALIMQKMSGKLPTRALFWCYPQDRIIDNSSDILSPHALNTVLTDALKVAGQIKAMDTTARPSVANCKWCVFKDACDASC